MPVTDRWNKQHLQEFQLMQYSEGKMGRVFSIRMDDGEDLIESIQRFIQEKEIESGIARFIGALRDGKAVTGPEEAVVPPEPHFEAYESAWEVFGMATIYQSKEGPKLHIHSSMGRGREALTGCIRDKAPIYLVIEAVLLEISGLEARREFDEKMGLFMLTLRGKL
jgi:predicted DNA-binding protein with PD1-like motif